MPSPETNVNASGGAGAASAPASASSTPAPPPLGTLIDDGTNAGALQLAAVLGYGGYGVVYRAVTPSGGLYAVKCLLRTSNLSNPKQAQRQRRLHMREITLHRLAGAGAHPGIVHLHRIIEPALPAEDRTLSLPSPYTFLVMDYAPCGDLFTLILHRQVYLGRTGLVAQVFAQLAAAVSHCHSLGIFHRDLKPENVLCWDGGATVRLADFGLATTERRSKEWRTGSVYHMSPECQNGNPSTPPYSPLANDIWSLAILLLNLLTARNPWARASPSDPTFSAYLASPRNFLPQVLPISSGLNDVLVRALDVRWDRREAFGVGGLADGVARLVTDPEEPEPRRSLAFGRQRMGMYAPDVVFEGGMARCPWEVGMHIPSGSSGSDEANSHHIRIPQELVSPPSPSPQAKPEPKVVKRRSSSASFVPSTTAQSPSPSFMLEASDVPPPTPAKEQVTVNVQPVSYGKRTPEPSVRSTQVTSRWSANSSASPEESTISEIRFANPSDAEELSTSASGSSTSSSEVSSVSSSYSETRTPGMKHSAPEPRVSDADLTLTDDAEALAYAYAASPDTPVEPLDHPKPPFPNLYTQPSSSPARRSRYRGRSRARQPYPQLAVLARRDSTARRAKFQPRRPRPELRLNVDLQAFLPLHVSGSATARTRSRSPASILDLRRRAREEAVESCPFAYSVSQSASFVPGPDMDIDGEHDAMDSEEESQPDFDIHMISPSCGPEEEEEEELAAEDMQRYSRTVDDSESFHTSFDGFSLSPSPVCTSPADATEDACEHTFRVSESVCTLTSPISPTSPRSVGVDYNGRSLVNIERSTVATTSPTDIVSPRSGNDSGIGSCSSRRRSGVSGYGYDYGFMRSSSPSASSSVYREHIGLPGRTSGAYGGMLEELMDTDESGADYRQGYGRQASEGERSGDSESWVDELRRVVDEENEHARMDTDEVDLPGLPGSFLASPAPVKRVVCQSFEAMDSEEVRTVNSRSADVQGLGLDLFTRSSALPQVSQHGEVNESGAARPVSARYSVPPPSIRSRTNSADEALRALHAIAVETPALNPWTDALNTRGWGHTSQSASSASTRGAQTFMAITTDSNANTSSAGMRAEANATVEDFREYVPYLRYVDSSSGAGSSRLGNEVSPAVSNYSFRAQQAADSVPPAATASASFRTSPLQCGETPDHQAQRRQDSPSSARRRTARSRSLLKFVSRRPFSSSSAGFFPARAPTPHTPTATTTAAALDTKSSLLFGASAAARFSAACASKDGGRISATVSDGKAPASGNIAQNTRPRSSSSPPPKEQAKSQRIESPVSPSPATKSFLRKSSTGAAKLRTWSFTRSRSQSRRRSRSLSPAPTKGTPRDVLFRLRSARNWFWYALSSMTSRSSSGSGARSKKGTTAKWAAPYVAVAA